MLPVQKMERLRTLIRETFAQLGADCGEEPAETILIRDGFYCGRRFECDGLLAVWFVEEDEIKFYSRDGAVAKVCSAGSPAAASHDEAPQRRAA